MTWARLDDKFHGHRKVKKAWRASRTSIGLHALALAYCADHETDGFVDVEFVEEKLPKDRERAQAVAALISAGMWIAGDDGWWIHDFLDFNPSAEQNAAKRTAKVEAGKKGAAARWGEEQTDADAVAPAIADAIGAANGTAMRIDAPVPTRTQQPSSFQSEEERPTSTAGPSGKQHSPEVEALCQLLSQLTRQRTETPDGSPKHRVTGQWRIDMDRLLRIDGRSAVEVEAAIRWVDRDPFWSTNILSPGKLRHQYDRIRLQAARPPPAQTADEARRERTRRRLSLAEPTEPEAA